MTLIFSGQTSVSGNVGLKKIILEPTLIQAITTAGLTANLKLALDAGDSNSYSGSGQDWVDTSGFGNADEFHRGATTGSEASDPTFNGSSGGLSDAEYWSHDGGDYFTYGVANETWMQNLHKNNAILSMGAVIYPIGTNQNFFFRTNEPVGGGTGISLGYNTNGTLRLIVWEATNVALSITTTLSVTTNAWNFVGISIDEAAGASGSHVVVNGSSETFNGTYSSPAVGNSSNTMAIGRYVNNFDSGTRLGSFFMTEGGSILSVANYATLFAALSPRFGL